jgi:multiple sugar transport system permease protein
MFWVCLALLLWVLSRGLRRIRVMWSEGDLGWVAATAAAALVILPIALAMRWVPRPTALVLAFFATALFCHQSFKMLGGREFLCTADQGFGSGIVFGLGLMVCELVLLGAGIVFSRLPAMAADGLDPPGWHTDYSWAKPAIMMIGFWAALGSNNMLLYLAGLTNVPAELYEAAHLDGASGLQRFWNVTWPQLAPTTFFIVVMSVIGGLQGGFETARALTRGGPDGATTTLSYFIYTEGFETGRLGYSSAVAWTLFLMVFAITLLNWKFGSRYVDE